MHSLWAQDKLFEIISKCASFFTAAFLFNIGPQDEPVNAYRGQLPMQCNAIACKLHDSKERKKKRRGETKLALQSEKEWQQKKKKRTKERLSESRVQRWTNIEWQTTIIIATKSKSVSFHSSYRPHLNNGQIDSVLFDHLPYSTIIRFGIGNGAAQIRTNCDYSLHLANDRATIFAVRRRRVYSFDSNLIELPLNAKTAEY